ncbi:T9SS type A sorting domain-containing protein [candidate division KSB1 bacterium]|nr:T9SS type A sorting domain-containing protein [candidate division KSB1 bacterium]
MKLTIHMRIPVFIWMITFGLLFTINAFAESPAADGFASMNILGQNGTTGGANGDTVTVTNTTDFLRYIDLDDPVIIRVDGTITINDMYKVNSNKTIIGVADHGVIDGGGLNLSNVSNIIIQNLSFINSMDDAINVQTESHHIWINHCDFTGAHDGLVDIKRGSDYITVSWNLFFNHHKTCLLGHSDNNAAQDTGKLRVTYHHNWFNGTETRHPRVRFSALCHVYNNYYVDNEYAVASTMGADVLVESNYFESVEEPTHVGYAASEPGDLLERNNVYHNCGAEPEAAGDVIEPPYDYVPNDAAEIPEIVSAGAGRAGFGKETSTSIQPHCLASPAQFSLEQNFPNPFNPQTVIPFQLTKDTMVEISIYNLSGQKIRTLVNEFTIAGSYVTIWDARDNHGHIVSSGTYFYRMTADGHMLSRTLTLVK